MAIFEPDRDPFLVPTVAKEVYDVTGAGDTVIGTMALALAQEPTSGMPPGWPTTPPGLWLEKWGPRQSARRNSRKPSGGRGDPLQKGHVSSTKITSILTRYSTILEFSTDTRKSTMRIPVIPRKVFAALAKPTFTASSNPSENSQ